MECQTKTVKHMLGKGDEERMKKREKDRERQRERQRERESSAGEREKKRGVMRVSDRYNSAGEG